MRHHLITVFLVLSMISMQTPAMVSAAEAVPDDVRQEETVVEAPENEEAEIVTAETDEGPEAGPEGTESEEAEEAEEPEEAEETEDAEEAEEAEEAEDPDREPAQEAVLPAEETGITGTDAAEESLPDAESEAASEEKERVPGEAAAEEEAGGEKEEQAEIYDAEAVVVAEQREAKEAAAEDQNEANDAASAKKAAGTGWRTVGGKKYYYKKDGTRAYGIVKISGVKYVFDPKTGELRTGLVTINRAVYLADKYGKMMTGWHTVDKKKYYFTDRHYADYEETDEGKRLSGFIYVGNHRYYLMNKNMKGFRESDFAAMAKGWHEINGYTYYMDPKTGIIAVGFETVGGKLYYFGKSGSRQKFVDWRTIDGKRYYFNSNYTVQRGLTKIGKDTFYLHPEKGEVVCGWKTINGKKYYFADERFKSYKKSIRGKRLTGFNEIAGKTYYFITREMSGYKTQDYASRATGWKTIDGKRYHFRSDGVMDVSWQVIGGHKYHFAKNGVMSNGMTSIGGKKYHFTNGIMDTGWKTINGKLYYFHKDGVRQEFGRMRYNGKVHVFDKNGVCTFKDSTINDVVSYAKKWVGKLPYKSTVTGNDPKNERKLELKEGRGSDCSWFVFHCLEKYGYLEQFVHSYDWGRAPHLYKNGKDIGRDFSRARPGDVLCYKYGTETASSKKSHVSIYVGNGMEVHMAAGQGCIWTKVHTRDLISIVRFSD